MNIPKSTFKHVPFHYPHLGPAQGARNRYLLMENTGGGFGFTTHTYFCMNGEEKVFVTYADKVQSHGPAALAGLREGDEILSVNGVYCYNTPRSHEALVRAIKNSGPRMLVVIKYANCVREVDPPTTVEDPQEGIKDNAFVKKKKSRLDIFRRRVGAPTSPKYIKKNMHYSPVILKKHKKRRSRSVEFEL